jgi:hypothetical protein
MPKGRAMSQLSRPYQIGLAVLTLLVAVWFVALRGHHGEPNPSPTTSTTSSVYHGSAPGVEGLTRAIKKAHGAAAAEQQHANRVNSQSAALAGESAATKSASTPTKTSSAPSSSSASNSSASHTSSRAHRGSSTGPATGAAKGSTSATARQSAVQHELAHGKVVVLLFWNPKSTDDQAVRAQLHLMTRRNGHLAIHVATPSEVTSFGGYTRTVQVTQTPATTIINGKNQITTLNGLTDARSIQQTIGAALKGTDQPGQAHNVSFAAVLHGAPLASREKFIAKAEAMCKVKRFYLARTKQEFAADLSKSIDSNSAAAAKARFVKLAPTADRPYIGRMIALSVLGVERLSAAFSSDNAQSSRIDLFHGQQDLDQAYNGLESYGIHNCVVLSG